MKSTPSSSQQASKSPGLALLVTKLPFFQKPGFWINPAFIPENLGKKPGFFSSSQQLLIGSSPETNHLSGVVWLNSC
ncbi:hypothetical protein [[Phormidium] sp. ETS-05]|uniref:hypothetical protein n=1 Tax=[Phormidium] sp. ETS-05 TaxID=222819 RepID=UPI0018EF0F46|nr:hypothetical protein [[Phormidium] sp. ETS-05]